jgi:UDP-glucuronate decarboxylase
MQKILVTGAAGFLGSHLVDFLLKKHHTVIGIDSLLTGNLINLNSAISNPNFVFHIADVRNPLEINADVIFNLACPASPKHYQKNPFDTFTTSVLGVQRLIEYARNHKCTIIQASTSEIYGDPAVHPQTESYCGNVNPIGPRACYDEGKRGAETLLSDAKRVLGLDTRIIRIFNTYGPRMDFNDGRVVSNFVEQALLNKPITIYGSGKQTRSFCYVDDLIDGFYKIMQLNYLDGPINLGNPNETTIQNLAELIVKLSNSNSTINYESLPEDDPCKRKPDISKAIKLIKFNPQISLESGAIKTIQNFNLRLQEMGQI